VTGVVLGLQGTVDYEVVWDSAILEQLVARHGIRADELDPDMRIDDERSLVIALLAHLRDGTGGERFIASSAIAESFARRFRMRVTLGGTCIRAALAMRELGIGSLLHLVSTDDTVRRLLPADCTFISSAVRDTLDPHLILQYRAGDRVRVGAEELVASGPNRVIFTNDPPARNLEISAELPDRLADARLFLVSGFNSIQEPEVLHARLAVVRAAAARMPEGSLVVFEDAGYHRPELSAIVRAEVAAFADVCSRNEDELQSLLGCRIDLLDADAVARALGELAALMPGPVHVVHTRHWSVAVGPDAERFRGALRGGIVMASTRYLHGDGLNAELYARTSRLAPQQDALAFAQRLTARMDVVVEPGLFLDTAAPTTIGLGDTFAGGFLAALVAEGAA
jgi:sugar/nucleoside kinase (ribokinase family)